MAVIAYADRISLDETFEYGGVFLVRFSDPLVMQSIGSESKCKLLFELNSPTIENLLLFPGIRVRSADEERRREILVSDQLAAFCKRGYGRCQRFSSGIF